MILVLGLLLLLSGTGGNLGVLLEGRPGDRVIISCTGVYHATRWAWAPRFPYCVGLPRGRRPILWASSSGTPTLASTSPFADRLRAVDPNSIEQLELRLARGDSGTFYCMGMGGRRESSTSLKVFGDLTACRSSGSTSGASYTLLLYALLGVGLTLGLVGLGMAWRLRQMAFSEPTRTIPEYGEIIPSPPALPPSPPTKAPPVNPETQSPWKEKPEKREDSDVEQNLLYADLDHIPHRNPKWLHSKVPKETATIYAVMV